MRWKQISDLLAVAQRKEQSILGRPEHESERATTPCSWNTRIRSSLCQFGHPAVAKDRYRFHGMKQQASTREYS